MKIELSLDTLKKLVKTASSIGPFLSLLFVIGAIGFSAWRLGTSFQISPSEPAIEAARNSQAGARIRFDVKTIDSLNSLVDVPTSIDTTNIGKPNPFAP
jgi:hypothetical protein